MSEQESKKATELNILDEEILIQKNIAKKILDAKKPLETIFTWKSPERFFEKKNTRWFIIVSAFALFAIVMSALTNNFILIFAIICLVLVIYSLYTIPPKIVEHQLTNKGIYTLNNLYQWKNISYFWVSQRSDQYILNFEYFKKSTDTILQRMLILVSKKDFKYVASYISEHIDYLGPENISKGFLSTFAEGTYISLQDIYSETDQTAKK